MKIISLFLLLILASFQVCASDVFGVYTVKPEVLNIRNTPNGSIIGKLKKDQLVTVYTTQRGWSRISPDGEPSKWVSSSSLHIAKNANTGSVPSTSIQPSYSAPSTFKPSYNQAYSGGRCSCSSGAVCFGPRGGRYCITSGGNKRYIGR